MLYHFEDELFHDPLIDIPISTIDNLHLHAIGAIGRCQDLTYKCALSGMSLRARNGGNTVFTFGLQKNCI